MEKREERLVTLLYMPHSNTLASVCMCLQRNCHVICPQTFKEFTGISLQWWRKHLHKEMIKTFLLQMSYYFFKEKWLFIYGFNLGEDKYWCDESTENEHILYA